MMHEYGKAGSPGSCNPAKNVGKMLRNTTIGLTVFAIKKVCGVPEALPGDRGAALHGGIQGHLLRLH
ncbi:Histo-blood group ABO system transferase [Apodemus speciosus]|uniref:Histo-blood group ABO system transferase n=1 Tax=Apodemus speciosus TaxID=105296 RepID=A0ABQ0EH00_APOSI